MPKLSPAQRSFSRGELAPSLYGRADLAPYSTALREVRNCIIRQTSGVQNRSGTTFIDEVRTPAKRSRLIPWVFNSSQAYCVEFGDVYIEFIRNAGRITLTAQDITGITKANPAVLTYSGSDTYANGDDVYVTGVVGMIEVNNRRFRVANVNAGANTFELTDVHGTNVNSTGYTTYTSGGTIAEIYTVTSPYVEADLQTLYYTQSGDVMTIVHPSYAPRTLTRTAHTTWTLSTITFAPDTTKPTITVTGTAGAAGSNTYRYQVTAANADYVESLPGIGSGQTISAITKANPTVLTYGGADSAWNNGDAVWIDTGGDMTQVNGRNFTIANLDTGANTFELLGEDSTNYTTYTTGGTVHPTSIRVASAAAPTSTAPHTVAWTSLAGAIQYWIYRETNGVYGYVGNSIGTSFQDKGNVTPDTYDTPPIGRNPFSQASDYPSCVTYYQQRQVFGNTDNNPETVWASRIGDFENLSNGVTVFDDEACTFTLAGQEVNEINHLVPMEYLLAFTKGGVWSMRGNSDGILTPLEPNAKQFSALGSNSVRPIMVSGGVVYVDDLGSSVLDLAYSESLAGYQSGNIGLLSEHLFRGYTITDMAYQRIPESIIWMVRSDGTLLSVTFNREQQLLGWAKHDTVSGDTFENVCAVPESTETAVYVVVKRTVNSLTKRYIERLSTREIGDQEDMKFMDCCLTYDGSSTTTVSGLMVLRGENVSVLGDGKVLANPNNSTYTTITVSSAGTITLPTACSVVQVGLPYFADIETLDFDAPQGNSLMGSRKPINNVGIYVEESRGIWVGTVDPGDSSTRDNLSILMPYNAITVAAESLTTDQKDLPVFSRSNFNGRVFIRQMEPVPMTILAVSPIFGTGVSPMYPG